MNKKELVLKAFHNEPAERIPVGFWFHFLPDPEIDRMSRPDLLDILTEGHRRYKEEFDPDFVKIMTDGMFFHPSVSIPRKIETAKELYGIAPLPENDRWFAMMAELVRRVREIYGKDVLIFLNVFSPLFALANLLSGAADLTLALRFLQEEPEAVAYALNTVGDDLCRLIDRVFRQAPPDGIYLSVTNNGRTIPAELYTEYVSPSERRILKKAREYSENNILHICGWRGRTNILSVYRDYEAQVFNWAVHGEGMSLKEGKEYFRGKAVIGGFDQMPGSLIDTGSRAAIEKKVEELIAESGKTGVIIGADCTIPETTPMEHLKWIRDKAAALS